MLGASLSPIVVLRARELAKTWLGAMGPFRNRHPSVEAAAKLLETIHDERPLPCADTSASLAPIRLELLYLCGKHKELRAEAQRRDLQQFGLGSGQFYLAEALLAEGQNERAKELYQAVEAHTGLRTTQPVVALVALERLGRVHERLGNPQAARSYYREMTKHWDQVDLPVPEVNRAKQRLRVLESEP